MNRFGLRFVRVHLIRVCLRSVRRSRVRPSIAGLGCALRGRWVRPCRGRGLQPSIAGAACSIAGAEAQPRRFTRQVRVCVGSLARPCAVQTRRDCNLSGNLIPTNPIFLQSCQSKLLRMDALGTNKPRCVLQLLNCYALSLGYRQ